MSDGGTMRVPLDQIEFLFHQMAEAACMLIKRILRFRKYLKPG